VAVLVLSRILLSNSKSASLSWISIAGWFSSVIVSVFLIDNTAGGLLTVSLLIGA
jgi:hypothetical protein